MMTESNLVFQMYSLGRGCVPIRFDNYSLYNRHQALGIGIAVKPGAFYQIQPFSPHKLFQHHTQDISNVMELNFSSPARTCYKPDHFDKTCVCLQKLG